jgi:hypothetical protein
MTTGPSRLARTLAAFAAAWALAAAAQEGRYQAVPIDGGAEYGTEKALILDTVAGHLWIWVESPAVNDEPGGRYLIYQGQLEPGKTMGQVIDRQEWRTSAPAPGD